MRTAIGCFRAVRPTAPPIRAVLRTTTSNTRPQRRRAPVSNICSKRPVSAPEAATPNVVRPFSSSRRSASTKDRSSSPAISTYGLTGRVPCWISPGREGRLTTASSKSFNGKFRSECLNTHWFVSLDDARQKMEDWRRDYNEVRPHSAIGHQAPISLLNGSSAPPPAWAKTGKFQHPLVLASASGCILSFKTRKLK